MTIRASGRAALIIAAGIALCISSPVQAAEEADSGVAASKSEAAGPPVALSKFRKSRHGTHASSHRKPVALASRTSTKSNGAKTARKKRTLDLALKGDEAPRSLPSSVANARAQLADADVSPDSAAAISQSRDRLQVMAANQPDEAAAPAAKTELVSADQLNEVDRALSETKSDDKPPATLAMTVAQVPAASASASAAAAPDDSAWGQTSLIGKIFIAFGALLTLASAARMFMA